jgi:hypothetical protein
MEAYDAMYHAQYINLPYSNYYAAYLSRTITPGCGEARSRYYFVSQELRTRSVYIYMLSRSIAAKTIGLSPIIFADHLLDK